MPYDQCDKDHYFRLCQECNAAPPGYMAEASRGELSALAYRVPLSMRTRAYRQRCGRPGTAIDNCLAPYPCL